MIILQFCLCGKLPPQQLSVYMSHRGTKVTSLRIPGVWSRAWMNRMQNRHNTLWLIMAVGVMLPKILTMRLVLNDCQRNDGVRVFRNLSLLCKGPTKTKIPVQVLLVCLAKPQNQGPVEVGLSMVLLLSQKPSSHWSLPQVPLGLLQQLPLSSLSCHLLHAPQGSPADNF